MALKDFRKEGADTKGINFFVFDDLRFQQNRELREEAFGNGPDVYRLDTLEEAIEKLQTLPNYMYPAMGICNKRGGEFDIIHRRNDEFILVNDFKTDPFWYTDEEILSLIHSACDKLAVEWQKCVGPFSNSMILTPFNLSELIDGHSPDYYFKDRHLRPAIDKNGIPEHPYSAINEVFVPGEGWLDYFTAKKKAEEYGFNNPHILKVTHYNINYKDKHGYCGQADILPHEFDLLYERYQIREGMAQDAQKAAKKLCEELSDCIYGYEANEADRKAHIAGLLEDIYKDNTKAIEDKLSKLAFAKTRSTMQHKAIGLLYRVQGIKRSDHKPELDEQIKAAGKAAAEKTSITEEKEQSR